MKKIIFTIIIFILSFNATAQNDKDFKSFYKALKKEKSIIGISAPIGIVNLFINREEKELKKIIRKGKKVRILVFDEVPKRMNADIKSFLPADKYQVFMSAKEDNTLIKLMVRDNKTFISELIIFVYEENSLVAMGINGEFSYDDIQKLTEKFQKSN